MGKEQTPCILPSASWRKGEIRRRMSRGWKAYVVVLSCCRAGSSRYGGKRSLTQGLLFFLQPPFCSFCSGCFDTCHSIPGLTAGHFKDVFLWLYSDCFPKNTLRTWKEAGSRVLSSQQIYYFNKEDGKLVLGDRRYNFGMLCSAGFLFSNVLTHWFDASPLCTRFCRCFQQWLCFALIEWIKPLQKLPLEITGSFANHCLSNWRNSTERLANFPLILLGEALPQFFCSWIIIIIL